VGEDAAVQRGGSDRPIADSKRPGRRKSGSLALWLFVSGRRESLTYNRERRRAGAPVRWDE